MFFTITFLRSTVLVLLSATGCCYVAHLRAGTTGVQSNPYQLSFNRFVLATTWFINAGMSFPGLQECKANELVISGSEGWRMLTSPHTARSLGWFHPVTNERPATDLSQTIALLQQYTNPFSPVTIINYQIPKQSRVRLERFDISGRRSATLVDGCMKERYHQQVHLDK